MTEVREIKVPDIGDFDAVEVIEVLVSVGDQVAVDDSLITLESDKASMDVPSPVAGKITSIEVSVGDQVGEGAVIAKVETGSVDDDSGGPDADADDEAEEPARDGAVDGRPPSEEQAPAREAARGAAEEAGGDAPAEERPAPAARERRGDEDPGGGAEEPSPAASTSPTDGLPGDERQSPPHASPSIRRFARELGVDLAGVRGSGPKGRILKEDVQAYVKQALQRGPSAPGAPAGAPGDLAAVATAAGMPLPALPRVDFSKFGEVEEVAMSRIGRIAAKNLHRSWLHVPHVTQFDEADITELEAFRKAQQGEAEKRGVKLTVLAFLMKATVGALREFPNFNASIHPSGEAILRKKYFHLGIAVDTEDGLVVPVIRDVDQKGIYELAGELGEVSQRARDKKLRPADVTGASFTISSLGGIGGTAFTPIVNAPEVAILGVARSKWQPEWNGEEFVPRLMLPFSVSYDHRVIDGASGARFTTYLGRVLGDLRRLLL